MGKSKILVIDDEPSILNVVTAYLRAEGYEYNTAEDGPSGLKAFRAFKPDLVVLDIMLPGMDGIEVLSQIRRESDVYVIMLTAKSEEVDKVVGLSIGADDYLTKPFSPRELMARIKAALRRLQKSPVEGERKVLTSAHVRIDSGSRRVWIDDSEVELTSLEFDLLSILAEHHGMVLSREQLLEKAWGYDYFGDLRVVDVHIGHLRQKVGSDYIETVRGAGYRFEDR
ncbi:response regulator transcription factor [Pelolinea submarina]|uniref:Two-component system alkaline phosphatase synthesis response regulator PhoP n=1 Tax=Pelolinea submarina TaxID=913107 RepID=A0A347ZWB9_9CHLR|nr:response regulator transcription factor [Pelolinea submarina]REG07299.1 two-component system alkaline phosphatase synthesis response regulator PhoP [Pelolinea submarina]BBB49600.1 two-component system response regulator [Pelolinea submarina]